MHLYACPKVPYPTEPWSRAASKPIALFITSLAPIHDTEIPLVKYPPREQTEPKTKIKTQKNKNKKKYTDNNRLKVIQLGID